MRERAGAVLLGALSLAPAVPVAAAGVDGAGRIVIVPLVVTGKDRESLVTMTNTGGETVRVTGLYVGAEGTIRAASVAGPIPCDPQEIPRDGSLSLPLKTLCPGAHTQDGENMGYLELVSDADAHANFFATSVTDTRSSTGFGVPGQPVGAYESGLLGATRGLEVAGLRTSAAQDEFLFCYLASLDEPKKVDVELRDDRGSPLAGAVSFALDPRRMVRFEVPGAVGLPPADRDGLRVGITSGDASLLVAGCGPVRPQTQVLSYQPAQAASPSDRARLRSVEVFTATTPGFYVVGAAWTSRTVGDPDDLKVVLSTYLRSDDVVRCRLIPWTGPTGHVRDTTPWTEIQILDPTGALVGGGDGARDTGVVKTPPRGRFPPGTSQRYLIQVSFDEASTGYPFGAAQGVWGVHCESGSGMSEPILLMSPFTDDF